MIKCVEDALKKYPDIELNPNKAITDPVLKALEEKKGMCPCFASMKPCICLSGISVAEGRLQNCRCGLFVRKLTAEVWSQAGCPRCDRMKEKLTTSGYIITERSLDLLKKGIEKDIDAMADLCFRNQELPIVKINGKIIDPEEFLNGSSD